MYESHFGLTASPFRLNPDPDFYYDSRVHSHALSYLKYGLHQGEGFIVVTGEIGAGKTTVVRTLLAELDTTSVVAAQIVSTQLESGELLRAILSAFGVPATHDSKAHVIATLEAFLTTVAAQGRRALLIVDEAQNLQRAAIEELRMLSNFQLGNHALLQSFLVGQPELRLLLKSRAMEQLRQRVIASCHIEPLDLAETRKYIEHRLHHVHWQGNPQLGTAAFERIFHCTGGVPRRINRLCDRLLLAAYLANASEISEDLVGETATELRLEISEVGEMPVLDRISSAGLVAVPRTEVDGAGRDSAAQTSPGSAHSSSTGGALMCLCDTPSGLWRLVTLAKTMRAGPDPVPLAIVYCGLDSYLPARGLDPKAIGGLCSVVQLCVDDARFVDLVTAAGSRFVSLLAESSPTAVVSHGTSDAVMLCTLVAKKLGAGVLRLEAGRREGDERLNSFLADHLADALFCDRTADRDALLREDVPSQHAHQVGSLVSSLLHFVWPRLKDEKETLAVFGLAPAALARKPYALLSCALPKDCDWAAAVSPMLPVLRVLSQRQQLIWPLEVDRLTTLRATSLANQLDDGGVVLVEERGYLDSLGLLRHAVGLVHCDQRRFIDEARVLGKPTIALSNEIGATPDRKAGASTGAALDVEQAARLAQSFVSGAHPQAGTRDVFDSRAASQVARLATQWLRERRQGSPRSVESLQ